MQKGSEGTTTYAGLEDVASADEACGQSSDPSSQILIINHVYVTKAPTYKNTPFIARQGNQQNPGWRLSRDS